MERKLASIQRALEIRPIENADAIELVRIKGWQCVTRKGEFRVGDLGVFLEIDAIPPDTDEFRFLWQPKPQPETSATVSPQPDSRPETFRIRTMKLRGVMSQGLFLPLVPFSLSDVREGDDVTERIGVGKYEPPPPTDMGDRRGSFPPLVPKTDEMRVQSVPQVLDELRGRPYVITQKVDGTSATFCIDPRDGEFHVCGRSMSIKPGENIYWRVAWKYDLEASLRRRPSLAIQGEVVGPGIQKNRLGLKETSLFAFSVFDISAARYLDHDDARAVFAEIGLPPVAVIEEGDCFQHTQASLLTLAEGKYPGTNNEREGLVVRPRHESISPTLNGRLSFKVISNRFLLRAGE
ncbi:MAG: RNA ligase (ATP) [Planctomycetota bacterium]|nr:RNA ligase (ATP) [Planctomycetota bacterium]